MWKEQSPRHVQVRNCNFVFLDSLFESLLICLEIHLFSIILMTKWNQILQNEHVQCSNALLQCIVLWPASYGPPGLTAAAALLFDFAESELTISKMPLHWAVSVLTQFSYRRHGLIFHWSCTNWSLHNLPLIHWVEKKKRTEKWTFKEVQEKFDRWYCFWKHHIFLFLNMISTKRNM